MGMVTEWTFTKKGRKIEAQRTRTFTEECKIDEVDRKKMKGLMILLTKIARRLKAEELEALRELEKEGVLQCTK